MRRRVMVGAAVAVGAGVVAYRRRRVTGRVVPHVSAQETDARSPVSVRGGRLVALLLAPVVFVITRAAWPWDPIIDFGGSAINQIKDWVKGALDLLWRTFYDIFLAIVTAIESVVSSVVTLGISLAVSVARLTGMIVEGVANAIQTAAGFAYSLVLGVTQYAESLFNAARTFAYEVLQAAARGIDDAKQWVLDHVARPLYQAVLNVMDWAHDNVLVPALDFARGLVDGVWSTLNTVAQMVADMYDFVVHVLHPFWQAAQWVIALVLEFAVDPSGTTDKWARTIISWMGPALRDAVVSAVHANEDLMEDLILRWLD